MQCFGRKESSTNTTSSACRFGRWQHCRDEAYLYLSRGEVYPANAKRCSRRNLNASVNRERALWATAADTRFKAKKKGLQKFEAVYIESGVRDLFQGAQRRRALPREVCPFPAHPENHPVSVFFFLFFCVAVFPPSFLFDYTSGNRRIGQDLGVSPSGRL